MINTVYISSEGMINKLQLLKGKATLNFYKNISNYYDEMNIRRQSGAFHIEESPFSKKVQSINSINSSIKNYHEVLLLIKFYKLNLRLWIWILNIMICIIPWLKISMRMNM